jgi:hypothetical protein
MDYAFKSTPKRKLCMLGLLDKSKLPGHCGFLLANLHKVKSLHFVPDENIGKNLEEFCIRQGNLRDSAIKN